MKKILVLYYSRRGATEELAKWAGRGIESVSDCEAVMRTVPPVSTVCEAVEAEIPESGNVYAELTDLENCDGLILGSPTRFGNIASPLKYFFDQSTALWINGALKDKPAAVFTSSSSMHGGQESTLLSMMLPLIHHGMIMVGLPFSGTTVGSTENGGTPYGASHVAGVDGRRPLAENEKSLAALIGRRVANTAIAMDGVSL